MYYQFTNCSFALIIFWYVCLYTKIIFVSHLEADRYMVRSNNYGGHFENLNKDLTNEKQKVYLSLFNKARKWRIPRNWT